MIFSHVELRKGVVIPAMLFTQGGKRKDIRYSSAKGAYKTMLISCVKFATGKIRNHETNSHTIPVGAIRLAISNGKRVVSERIMRHHRANGHHFPRAPEGKNPAKRGG